MSVSPKSPVSDIFEPVPTPPSSELNHKQTPPISPINVKYYNDYLTKPQFNFLLVNCSVNLLRMLYPELDFQKSKLRFFIVEILRRSKTSVQSLQLTCFYLLKILKKSEKVLPQCPKKFFLGLLIIASKFNQDLNYLFKSWLKICGCNGQSSTSDFNLKVLKQVEVQCLQLLDYNCYINGLQYENWCNILAIFGYDFIRCHKCFTQELIWEAQPEIIESRLQKWKLFLSKLNFEALLAAEVHFSDYYVAQIGKKVVLSEEDVPTLFSQTGSKRQCGDAFEFESKRYKVSYHSVN